MNINILSTRKPSHAKEEIEPSHRNRKIQGLSAMICWSLWIRERLLFSSHGGNEAEEGELRIRPWKKALCASLSWLKIENHWRVLSKTVV